MHKELIEREAERCYPAHSSWHYNYAFMRGANFALEIDRWVKVEDGCELPEKSPTNDKRSINVQTWYKDDCVKAFYSYVMAEWLDCETKGVFYPTHWQPLPNLPK